MFRRISYYLLSVVFVAGMVACGGKSHDHLDHDRTNTRACEAECPKNESIANIARLNREFIKAKLAD